MTKFTVESRFLEAPKRKEIGSRNRKWLKNYAKLDVHFHIEIWLQQNVLRVVKKIQEHNLQIQFMLTLR